MKHRPRRSLRWRLTCAGASLGALALAVAVFLLVFGGAILNGYGKPKAERAFAAAHPGLSLQIDTLEYSWSANRLVARSVTLRGSNTTLQVGRISLTGVHWVPLLWGAAVPADVLAQASLDATNLNVELQLAGYEIRCGRLRASVPDSHLIAEEVELRPWMEDEAFFAARDFRRTRFHVVVPECRVQDLAYDELLAGRSYRAGSVQVSRPAFDALVNWDKPVPPFAATPLMVHEALASIRQPLQVGSLSITNGLLRYCERRAIGSDPAVLTFGALSLSVQGLANQPGPNTAIQVHGQGDLMNAGTLKVRLSIPVTPSDFSLHYSGSLSAMDLTRLNAFLDTAEYLRIKSGTVQEAAFEINVTASQALGFVQATYADLEIALLDHQNGTEKGLDNRVASLLANVLKVRNSNDPDASRAMTVGEVSYTRSPDDEFQQFLWFALRTGVLDVISH